MSVFNVELFRSAITAKRNSQKTKRAQSYWKAAAEIGGISGVTLFRVENGRFLPNIETFMRICIWLNIPADTFIKFKE
jgi:transcriptional regulator with XRE-family HTH domain